jgi:ATP-dependent DNA ligase
MVMLCHDLNKAELPIFAADANSEWIAEIKFDGDRIVMKATKDSIVLKNRRGDLVTDIYPEFWDIKGDWVLDGEMCVMNSNGVSEFNEGITHRSHCKDMVKIREAMKGYPVTFVVFDILEYAGEDMKDKSWVERRSLLEQIWNDKLKHNNMVLSEYNTNIIEMWQKAVDRKEEGIILKRRDSVYTDSRSRTWLKVKDVKEIDLKFTKLEQHNKGITIETDYGIRVTVNGERSKQVQRLINENGSANVTIRHLGETKAHRFRQPTYLKIVDE